MSWIMEEPSFVHTEVDLYWILDVRVLLLKIDHCSVNCENESLIEFFFAFCGKNLFRFSMFRLY